MISIDMEGLAGFLGDLGKYIDSVELAVEKALYQEGEELMSDAKPLTPVDEGVLRASGHVNLPETDENGDIFVDVGFGGPAGIGNQGGETNSEGVAYAIVQHEDLSFFHTTGQAKFLEQPLNERKPDYSKRLASRIARNV